MLRHHSPATPARAGFTLIELSIVLVIIGLIVGGVLVGRDLIHVAALRGDITEIEKMDSAVQTFYLKYNALPGDMKNASTFFTGAHDGDGDGLIASYTQGPLPLVDIIGNYVGYEPAFAIDDLARAHLISLGPFDATDTSINTNRITPALRSSGHFIIHAECVWDFGSGSCPTTNHHAYRLGVNDGTAAGGGGTLGTDLPIYTGKDAFYIDSKKDDGFPWTGIVTTGLNFTSDSSAFMPFFPGFSSIGCEFDASTNLYGIDNDTLASQVGCGIFIRASY